MESSSFTKAFHNLLKTIDSLSGGQARVSEWDDEDLSKCEVEISPSGGLYKYAKFKFQFQYVDNWTETMCICKTPIYHPNIDTVFDYMDSSNVCVDVDDYNSLDDWVQGLLFLLYNPNLEDSLCPIISPETTKEEFEENVRISLEGGNVDGILFETNYGYLENEIVKNKNEINEKGFGGNVDTYPEVIIRNYEKMSTGIGNKVNTEANGDVYIENTRGVNVEVILESLEHVNMSHQSNVARTTQITDEKITNDISD